MHCAVISWLLKKVPVGRGARVAFSWAPWLPLLQVPKLWLLDVHVCDSFAFPLTSNDSCLTSYDFWLTSNDLLFTSNDFWLTSYDFWLTSNNFWLTFNDLWLMSDGFWLTSNGSWLTSHDFWLTLMISGWVLIISGLKYFLKLDFGFVEALGCIYQIVCCMILDLLTFRLYLWNCLLLNKRLPNVWGHISDTVQMSHVIGKLEN